MTLRRATLYIGGASLLVAWFSSAASLSLYKNNSQPPSDLEPNPSPMEALASLVQQQSARLRDRAASAPRPQQPLRNPFSFRSVPPPQATGVAPVQTSAAALVAAEPPEPTILLIGVAEQKKPQGLVRTALFATDGDQLVMATVGETVLGRYTVSTISVDAVELMELATGRTRRLALQF